MSRFPALDAARTSATILVVAGHAVLSFMVTPIGWAIQDRSQHLAVDAYAWALRGFAMPLFFWLSGFASAVVFARGGAAGFVLNRATRILLPLAIALVPCSLAIDAVWDWGREVGQRGVVPDHIPKFQGSEVPILLGHLWYLYYLLWMSLVALVIVRVVRGIRAPSGPVIFALPVACSVLVLLHLGALHTDTPLGFVPDVPIFLYMGSFFAWGWLVHARLDEATRYRDHACRALGVAAVMLTICLVALARGGTPAPYAIVASGLYTVSMIVFFLGVHARHATSPGPVLRVAGESAYWSYIVHLPVAVALQIVVAPLAIPGVIKYCLILTLTCVICVGSYVVVRRLWSAPRISLRHR